jgi:hypothetical protein
MHRRAALLVICVVVASAPLASAVAQRSDSTAARTIKYGRVSQTVALTKPALTLPQDDCELNRVSAVLLQEGGIVVANRGNLELCLFDAAGKFVKKAGRRGAGPGEFADMTTVAPYRGDSILVADGRQHRVTIFDRSGARGREFRVTPPDSGLGSNSLTMPLNDGSFILGFSEFVMGPPSPDAEMFHQRVFRFDPAGGSPSRVGVFPINEHFVQRAPPEMGGVAYWDLAFGRSFSSAPFGDGFGGGDGSDGTVREYDGSGKLRAIHDLGLERKPVTASTIESYRSAALRNAKPAERQREELRVNEMPFPKQLPAYDRVLTDDKGRIWVEPYGSTLHWLRADPATRSVDAFGFPPRFKLLSIRGARACGIGRDDVDLETVYCFLLPR